MGDLAVAVVNELEEKRAPFVIDDMAKAEWAMKKIAKASRIKRQRIVEYEQIIADYTKEAKAWLDDQIAEQDDNILYFESALRPFAAQQLEGAKKKSFNLPSGKVGFRAGTKKFMIGEEEVKNDNEKLLKFVKSSMSELIKIKETVDWAEMKKSLIVDTNDGKVITKDGEIVSEMQVIFGEDKFFVDVK